jgi:hypothetical protein
VEERDEEDSDKDAEDKTHAERGIRKLKPEWNLCHMCGGGSSKD